MCVCAATAIHTARLKTEKGGSKEKKRKNLTVLTCSLIAFPVHIFFHEQYFVQCNVFKNSVEDGGDNNNKTVAAYVVKYGITQEKEIAGLGKRSITKFKQKKRSKKETATAADLSKKSNKNTRLPP